MKFEGQQIDRYHIVRHLGSGGMGAVYLAKDERIDQQVAIKLVRIEGNVYDDKQEMQETVRLFQREARAIVRLDHPNILPLFDYGEEHLNGVFLVYLVMPYRPEGSLTDFLRRRTSKDPLTLQDVTHFVQQTADALQHAHDHQVIHQDVKPSNLLLRQRQNAEQGPDVLLADFGIARFSSATSSVSQTIRGTPLYMAPEQWKGKAEPATDQYALAVMAYELLAGRPPFQGNQEQLMYQHLHEPPPSLTTLHPGLPREVEVVLLQALHKSPERRFGSITEFANAFLRVTRTHHASHTSTIQSTSSELPARHENLHATLAISEEEARLGTQRVVTVPGGRRVTVTVPPATAAGTILHLIGQGEAFADGSGSDDLLLTVVITQEKKVLSNGEKLLTPSSPLLDNTKTAASIRVSIPPTLPADLPRETNSYRVVQPHEPRTDEPVVFPTQKAINPETPVPHGSITPLPPPITLPPPAPRQRGKRSLLLPIGAILLVIIMSASGFIGYRSIMTNIYAASTRTAQTNADSTATALSKETSATASAQADADATAQAIASETAVAQASATAQARAEATASVAAANPYPGYLTGHGKLALYDSLQPPQSTNISVGNNTCQVTDNVYHVVAPDTHFFYTCYLNPAFANFALEVQMTIVKGNCGGIIFRSQSTASSSHFYLFRVCQDQTYALVNYPTNAGTDSKNLDTPGNDNSAIISGLNQANTIALVADGSTFTLYINNQQIASVQDNSFSEGNVGLIADPYPNSTDPPDVVYHNLKVWTL